MIDEIFTAEERRIAELLKGKNRMEQDRILYELSKEGDEEDEN